MLSYDTTQVDFHINILKWDAGQGGDVIEANCETYLKGCEPSKVGWVSQPERVGEPTYEPTWTGHNDTHII